MVMMPEGQKALDRIGLLGNFDTTMTHATDDIMNTLRVLCQTQDHGTTFDVSDFFSVYMGPPEVAELMLSQDLVRYEILHTEDYSSFSPPLVTGLRMYGTGVKTWERIIRLLLRSGNIDLHAQVPHDRERRTKWTTYYPFALSGLVTPLDELFMWTDSPNHGDEVAFAWLQMLADEGFDVLAYLRTEQALHDIQEGFTYPSLGKYLDDTLRKLVFQFEPNPVVSWEWWVDRVLPASLVRQEFLGISSNWNETDELWEEFWPFRNPFGQSSERLKVMRTRFHGGNDATSRLL